MKETFLRKRLNTILYQKETIDEVVSFVENTVKLLGINDACIVSVEDREYRASVSLSIQCGRNVVIWKMNFTTHGGSALDPPWHWAHRALACMQPVRVAPWCPMMAHFWMLLQSVIG